MSWAPVASVTLVLVLSLSGCIGGDKDGGDNSSSSTSTSTSRSTTTSVSGTSSGSSSSTGSAGPGTIALDFTRTTPDGAVPLPINFTLAATFTKGGVSQPTPAGLAWSIRIANATNASASPDVANATAGPSGTSLPANFTLNFTAAGAFVVLAEASAPQYTPANASIRIAAIESGPGVPLFFDGAEGDASQWTISSNVWFFEIFTGTEEEFDAEHPAGMWEQSTAAAHEGTKSWYSHYPDNYRTRMTSVAIEVPAGGATLSYWLKGGAEANGADGVHVLVNDVEVALHNDAPEWTQFTHPVPAGSLKVQFRFDADAGCSSDGPPEAAGSNLCGAGYTAGGFYLDDVRVD